MMMTWGRLEDVQKEFGLPPHVVRRIAKSGQIRSFKTSGDKRAATVYRMQDIADYLDENCLGRAPTNKTICGGQTIPRRVISNDPPAGAGGESLKGTKKDE